MGKTSSRVEMDKGRYNFVGSPRVKSHVKLLLLFPFPPVRNEEGPFEYSGQPYLMPSTSVDELYCIDAPVVYSDPDAAERATPLVIEKVKWAESQGYDAVVVGCMVDPGVRKAKEAVNIPVIGIREATLAVAPLIGSNPGHVYPGDIPVPELSRNEEKTYSELVKVSRWLVAKRSVDVLIPNCALISGLAYRLQSEVGVPVLPNVEVGLKMAELLSALNVRPERPWVEARRVRKVNQFFSRFAWQVRHWLRMS